MSRFSDHFKAEIFSEAFTRMFFAGPAGRIVAGTFVFGYAMLKGIGILLSLIASLLFNVGAFGWKKTKTYEKLRFRSVGRNLHHEARRFGDQVSERSDADWRIWHISGDGYRFGPFELELKTHASTEAVIVRITVENQEFEVDAWDFLRIAESPSSVPKPQYFAEFYKNLRAHWI